MTLGSEDKNSKREGAKKKKKKKKKKLIGTYLLTPHHKPQHEPPIQLQNPKISRGTPRCPLSINLPLCFGLFPNDFPELLPRFLIMAISQTSPARTLTGSFASHVSSDNKGSRTRMEQVHDTLSNNLLKLIVEQVEEGHGVDDAKLAGEIGDERGVVIEDVRLDKGRFKSVAVIEKVVTNVC